MAGNMAGELFWPQFEGINTDPINDELLADPNLNPSVSMVVANQMEELPILQLAVDAIEQPLENFATPNSWNYLYENGVSPENGGQAPAQPLQFHYQWPQPHENVAQPIVITRDSANFCLELERGRTNKASPWAYSEKLGTLFVNRQQNCPVQFKTSIPALFRGQYLVRAQIRYTSEVYKHKPVERCENHKINDQQMFKPHPSHILLCDEQNGAVYEVRGGHHSVRVPLEPSSDGNLSLLVRYQFGCFNSCGSIDRRATSLIFSLVTLSGEEIDRKELPVQMCSCPGRDIRLKEEKAEKLKAAKLKQRPKLNQNVLMKAKTKLQPSIQLSKLSNGQVILEISPSQNNQDISKIGRFDNRWLELLTNNLGGSLTINEG